MNSPGDAQRVVNAVLFQHPPYVGFGQLVFHRRKGFDERGNGGIRGHRVRSHLLQHRLVRTENKDVGLGPRLMDYVEFLFQGASSYPVEDSLVDPGAGAVFEGSQGSDHDDEIEHLI